MLFVKIAISYTLPDSTDRRPREHRETTAPTPNLKKVHFLNIAFLKRLTESLKKLTQFLKKFPPFLKHLTSCTSRSFLRTASMPLCPLSPNPIWVKSNIKPFQAIFSSSIKIIRKRFAYIKNKAYLCNAFP